jgi:hypothetical protein
MHSASSHPNKQVQLLLRLISSLLRMVSGKMTQVCDVQVNGFQASDEVTLTGNTAGQHKQGSIIDSGGGGVAHNNQGNKPFASSSAATAKMSDEMHYRDGSNSSSSAAVPTTTTATIQNSSCVVTVNDFLFDSHLDSVNLHHLLRWVKDSKLLHKVRGLPP